MKGTLALALAALLCPAAALATAGYFQLGYGMKAKGMGGVGIALPQDALAGTANPAGMAWVGNRADFGLEWFTADRGSDITPGNTLGLSGSRDANGRKSFLVPGFGVNRMLGEDRSIGLTVVGDGGLTRYQDNPLASLGGSTPGGLDFARVVAAPSFAMRLGENHTVGVALQLVYQQFSARGLEHFDDPEFTHSVGYVTNRGRDHATGAGVRIGWLGRFTDALTLGATWQPAIRMSKFDSYKGLLVKQGSFDVPEQYGVGAALQVNAALTLAADIERINFAGVSASTLCFLQRSCFLGDSDGPGSGWRNTTVYKLGAAWQVNPQLTLRAGFATLRQPIPAGETLINVFAPAVSRNHLTLGATWQLSPAWELSASLMHAFTSTVSGVNSIPAGVPPGGVGGAEANLRMRQDGVGLSLGWRM